MVRVHKTSLGDSEAFPSEDEYPYDYMLLKKRYVEVCDNIDTLGLGGCDEDFLTSELSSLVRKCKELEKPIRDSLQRVCENTLNRLFAIPPEMVNMKFRLVDKVKLRNGVRMKPESSEDLKYTFKDISDIDLSNKAVSKRRFVNALIQGASYIYSGIEELYYDDISKMNPELPELYTKIRLINDYLLFIKKETMSDDKPMQGSYVETHIGISGNRCSIDVQGIIFPLLLQESIKGLFEIFSSHGLPQDRKKAEYVIKKADFILAEPWDIRLGVGLWKEMFGAIDDTNIIPYVFTSFIKLPTDEFNLSVKEVLSRTEKGNSIMMNFIETAAYDNGYQQFTNRINAKNLDKSLISDSYFTGAESNGYELDSDDGNEDVIVEDDYLEESHFNKDRLITESQESKSRHAAIRRVMQTFNYDKEKALEVVYELRNTISSLKQGKCGKFEEGVARMYCDGQLRDVNTMSKLNATLKYVASDAHINEYDRNLNEMSAQDIIDRFAVNIEMDLENDRNKLSQKQYTGVSDYDIVRIDSFEQATKYYEYTYEDSRWCLTYMENMFETYTCGGINQIYFCLRKGFENVEPIPGEGRPLDEYGLSMLSVIVNENGALVHCTSRWNHKNGGSDNVMNTEQISNVIQMDFYSVFKPNNTWNEILTNAMQRLANGEDPREVFDKCDDFKDGFARVQLGKKWNFIKQNGEILSIDQWFDSVWNFKNGFGAVEINEKYNFINQNGEILSLGQWFDFVWRFENGFGVVEINEKYNFINQNGVIIYKPDEPDQWFDKCELFENGLARVWVNEKSNFITPNGELVWKQPIDEWFDWITRMEHGLKQVSINGKYNIMKQNGELVWKQPIDQWFDYCTKNSRDGFAIVELNGKCNLITPDGEILWKRPIEKWFDEIWNFREGFAKVEVNGKYNYINRNGKLLWKKTFGQWFDNAREDFKLGFAEVLVNGEWYYIDWSGNITLI